MGTTMQLGRARGWRSTALSPRLKSALGGVVVGAVLSLLLVAAPLWLLGGAGSNDTTRSDSAPLAALATLPAEPAHFDISNILAGEWSGEVCPDDGEPISVHFEFVHNDDAVEYTLSLDGEVQTAAGTLRTGSCVIEGEDIAFHAFLAILSECDEACGVDRFYEGHFEEGTLVGSYSDAVRSDDCLSCVGGGTWWLEPDDGLAQGREVGDDV